jgi:hypothetical protein
MMEVLGHQPHSCISASFCYWCLDALGEQTSLILVLMVVVVIKDEEEEDGDNHLHFEGVCEL